jgi:hypothetical protein
MAVGPIRGLLMPSSPSAGDEGSDDDQISLDDLEDDDDIDE